MGTYTTRAIFALFVIFVALPASAVEDDLEIVSGPGVGEILDTSGQTVVGPASNTNGFIQGKDDGCAFDHFHGTLKGAADPDRNGCGWGIVQTFNQQLLDAADRVREHVGNTYGQDPLIAPSGRYAVSITSTGVSSRQPLNLTGREYDDLFGIGDTGGLSVNDLNNLSATFAAIMHSGVSDDQVDMATEANLAAIQIQGPGIFGQRITMEQLLEEEEDKDFELFVAVIEAQEEQAADRAARQQAEAKRKVKNYFHDFARQLDGGVIAVEVGLFPSDAFVAGSTVIQQHTKDHLVLVKSGYLTKLFKSLAAVAPLVRSDGSVTEGSFAGMDPTASLHNALNFGSQLAWAEDKGETAPSTATDGLDNLVAVDGQNPDEAFFQMRLTVLNGLLPVANTINDKKNAYDQAEERMRQRTSSAHGADLNAGVGPSGTVEDIVTLDNLVKRTKQEYYRSMDGNGLLLQEVETDDFEGPFFEWLAQNGTGHKDVQSVFDQALGSYVGNIQDQIKLIAPLDDVKPLVTIFGSDGFEPLRNELSSSAELTAIWPALPGGMGEIAGYYDIVKAQQTVDERYVDVALAIPQVPLVLTGTGSVFFFVIEAGLVVAEVGVQGVRAYDAHEAVDAATNAARADAGATNTAIIPLQLYANSQTNNVILTAALGGAGLSVSGFYTFARKVDLPNGSVLVDDAGDIRFVDAPSGAVLSRVDDPAAALNRVDLSDVPGATRAGGMSADELRTFYRNNGLEPKVKVQVDGQTWHLSDPFIGPEGKNFIIAFEEGADGKLIPRTWYLSGSHGTWRALPAYIDGTGGFYKGNQVLVKGNDVLSLEEAMRRGNYEGPFINENVVNLDPRLQAVASEWTNTRPAINLSPDAGKTAATAHVENPSEFYIGGRPTQGGREFNAAVNAGDYRHTIDVNAPGSRPNFGAGPQVRWNLPANHPSYPGARAASVPSENGDFLYTFIDLGNGKTFCTDIHMVDDASGLTQFGTSRRNIFDVSTEPPATHATKDAAGNVTYDIDFDPPPGSLGHNAGQNYDNIFNRPPPVATTSGPRTGPGSTQVLNQSDIFPRTGGPLGIQPPATGPQAPRRSQTAYPLNPIVRIGGQGANNAPGGPPTAQQVILQRDAQQATVPGRTMIQTGAQNK